MSKYRAGLLLAILITALIPAATALASPAGEPLNQIDQAYVLVDLVNALRAEYGLAPYQVNLSLMTAAQLHSEWAASAGYHSHTEPDGSRPRDRAARAGYGGGAEIWVSENIYWGGMATLESAIQWWRNSEIHFAGMTSTRYQEIGAGVAQNADGGYYTLLFGIVSGNEPAAPASSSDGGAAAPASGGGLVPPASIVQSTPGPDGAIVHTVASGEVPVNIAEAYSIDLYVMLAQNGLSEGDVIFPGDQLIIKLPDPATPTPAVTATPTASATPPVINTARPLATSSAVAVAEVSGADAEPLSDVKPTPSGLEMAIGQRVPRGVLIGIFGALALAGAALVVGGLRSAGQISEGEEA